MWGFSGTNPALILGLSFELAARLQAEMPVHPDFLSSAETWTCPGKTWELLLYGVITVLYSVHEQACEAMSWRPGYSPR